MKIQILKFLLIITSLFLTDNVSIFSQVILVPEKSSVVVKGTSTLHDWHEEVNPFTVNLVLTRNDNVITGIENVGFTCKASSLKSESSLMTHKTIDALKADSYPEISFSFISTDSFVFNNDKIEGSLKGNISLAGVSRSILIAFTGEVGKNSINIKGSKSLKMSEFQIKPPTAFAGVLKTGDEVTIDFNLQFRVSDTISKNSGYQSDK